MITTESLTARGSRIGVRLSPAHRRMLIGAGLLGTIAFTIFGAVGAYRYLWTFAVYRGEPGPSVPARVVLAGTHPHVVKVLASEVAHLDLASAALGGRKLPVVVVLPPGYSAKGTTRYPTMYLLEGYPALGGPDAFVNVGGIAALESVLVAEGRMSSTILVMPSGSPSLLVDTEWANGVRPKNDWETYVSHDLVAAISKRFRTIDSGASRALGGLSEGGYGALNIGIHHPGEFRVLESWSGYTQADKIPSVFGTSHARLVLNSPAKEVPGKANALRRAHTYVWFYCGTNDYDVAQNRSFDKQLTGLGVGHRFFIVPGNHNWGLWRSQLANALIVASAHLQNG